MRYKIDIVIDTVSQVYNEVLQTLATHHTIRDLLNYIEDVGSVLEGFLKESIYKSEKNRENFFSLINGLSKFGLSEDLKTSLHELRKLYNNAKHSPTYKTSTDKILEILKETISCLKEIKEKNLGFDPIVNTYRRTVWIAGWDHYTTGDTEVHIMIPYDGDRYIPSIDYFNITWSGWDEIINKFVSTEELLMGKEYFPRKVYSDLESERDFVDAGVFKGDYKTLVLELSKYVDEKNEKSLLPFFQRGNNPRAMFYGVIYAVCEAINEKGFRRNNIEEFRKSVQLLASYKYACPRNSEIVQKYIISVADFLMGLNDEHTKRIEGPLFFTQRRFEMQKNAAYLKSKELPLIITNQGEFIVEII
ncbi:hypothetical protein IM717_00750 [Bacillus velezensis]|nr:MULTISPECIES: hypothetical protein [Bacillus]ARM29072.1 hypothetical protein B9C48_15090 [Bacillus vallismortis]ANF37967.1 hypothetical protein BCBMB205_30770 [Bacillus velezensis]ANS39569.1 hypothetical protein A5891_14730 [Bacillus velezensis]ANU31326.1 hypothetical protein A8142_14600 [Bacillus velezensis]APQ51466.1 hypothetical protein BSO20_16320 [Bacillus amyloliquefaciens]